jgi:hypothetical protein
MSPVVVFSLFKLDTYEEKEASAGEMKLTRKMGQVFAAHLSIKKIRNETIQ